MATQKVIGKVSDLDLKKTKEIVKGRPANPLFKAK